MLSKKNKERQADAIEKLKIEQDNWNPEYAHENADDILCNLLIELGFIEVVHEYNKVEKWYA